MSDMMSWVAFQATTEVDIYQRVIHSTSSQELAVFSTHESPGVRYAVADHPKTGAETLITLSHDPIDWVARRALKTIMTLYKVNKIEISDKDLINILMKNGKGNLDAIKAFGILVEEREKYAKSHQNKETN